MMGATKNKHIFKKWDTPISKFNGSTLWCILDIGTKLHFMFISGKAPNFRTYILTLPEYVPYRLHEKKFAANTLGKKCKFNGVDPDAKKTGTWKLQGKKFFNVIQKGQALCHEVRNEYKDLSQYLIVTDEDWLEFVSCRPLWTIHNTTEMTDLLNILVEKKTEGFSYWMAAEEKRNQRNLKRRKKSPVK